MKKFCKIFETEKYGQILARMAMNENNDPEIVISIMMPSPLDVCSIQIAFTSTSDESALANRESFMQWLDEEKALEYAYVIMDTGSKFEPREHSNVTEH